jgi:propionate CoA-transferase
MVQDQRIHDLHLLTEPMVSDTYFSMIAYLEQRYYSSASRYTTSAFMRLKLGEGLSERHVAPHIFETRAEAQAFARSQRKERA